MKQYTGCLEISHSILLHGMCNTVEWGGLISRKSQVFGPEEMNWEICTYSAKWYLLLKVGTDAPSMLRYLHTLLNSSVMLQVGLPRTGSWNQQSWLFSKLH